MISMRHGPGKMIHIPAVRSRPASGFSERHCRPLFSPKTRILSQDIDAAAAA
jgi:hypothetical protein